MSKLICNIFRDTFSQDCSYRYSAQTILGWIQEGKWKDKIEEIRFVDDKKKRSDLKKRLPGVTFSGVFEKARKESNLIYYTRLMIIDIDEFAKGQKEWLKECMQRDPFCFAYFESPSGGLKVLFRVNTHDTRFHKSHAFADIEEYFMSFYDTKIDKSGKDWSRLCYVSYDPDLYINEDYIDFIVMTNKRRDLQSVEVSIPDWKEVTYDTKKIFEVCQKMVNKSKTGNYSKGNRNNYIFAMSCLLCEFGVDQGTALAMVQHNYSLGLKEIETTVKSAFRTAKPNTKQLTQRRTNQQNLF